MSGIAQAPGTWLDGETGAVLDHASLMVHMAQRRVVLLGETHDRYDIHRWQLHVCAGLLAHRTDIALGFEMFPLRCQPVLDRWVDGALDVPSFLEQAEWETVWRFDPALYLPLFHFCRENRLPMLALNCERPLVTRVGKEGWDAIPEAERDGLTPAVPASAAHRQHLFAITGGGRGERSVAGPQDPAFDRFVRAQQTWDRAFACNIAKGLASQRAGLILGIIGRGHMDYRHGTPFQLAELGVDDTAVLLPSDEPVFSQEMGGIGDAVFRLPGPPERAERLSRKPIQEF
ncbi:MAG: ChaN family lipoprotein [Candidatus Devosia phytovorans]|uniref:ChaN family lipoprotein n=1 Tax=Candidatus Devosia phytovorans TaxID=3121372 RepID=A0AAJ5VW00_9HYPH|nr:ChaN family lipoprotein [Devosia sp.]WEK04414.1 MAG: ChaN family lipoprotein [Devosia sp.]